MMIVVIVVFFCMGIAILNDFDCFESFGFIMLGLVCSLILSISIGGLFPKTTVSTTEEIKPQILIENKAESNYIIVNEKEEVIIIPKYSIKRFIAVKTQEEVKIIKYTKTLSKISSFFFLARPIYEYDFYIAPTGG